MYSFRRSSVGLFVNKPMTGWIGAGECIVSGPQGTQRVLVHDVTRAHDVCNASYRAFKRCLRPDCVLWLSR